MKNINNNDINELKKAVSSGSVDDFINKRLSPEQSEKIKKVLSDKNATQKLLSTPQAKELLKKLNEKQGQ